MEFLSKLLKKNKSEISNISDIYFSTNLIGGIKVNVTKLLNSDYPFIQSYVHKPYISQWILNPNDPVKIGESLLFIMGFGIVGNTYLLNSKDEYIKMTSFELRHAHECMIDSSTKDSVRIDKMLKSKNDKFNWII